MRPSLSTLALLLVAGCGGGDGTFFELSMEITALEPGDARRFVRVQVRDAADSPFTDEWTGNDVDPFARGDAARVETLRLSTTDDDKDLNVKVRLCISRECEAPEDAEALEDWYAIEHPFWAGETTSYRLGEPGMVDRCQIRGCTDGELSSYCRVDGRHLCEL